VSLDDREAPAGCAALRLLRDVPLVRRAVGALARSGMVSVIVVPAPPALVPLVAELVATAGGPATVEVLPVHENGPGHRVLAALRAQRPPPWQPVVVHDPLHPLAPAALVTAVLGALTGALTGTTDGARWAGPEGQAANTVAVPVRPVTDTLKWVDQDDVVTGPADRQHFRMVYSPQAYWPAGLLAALGGCSADELRAPGAEVLPRLVHQLGGRLLPVPAPGEVFRISTTEDLVLAEAMLHVGADSDDEPLARRP
jgi:2-C-methyl-D-erythritol 4-phosphate cytidylyltransferase